MDTYETYMVKAQKLAEEGALRVQPMYPTKAAQKQAAETCDRAFQYAKYAVEEAKRDGGSSEWLDLPHNLCHWRAKHRAAVEAAVAGMQPALDLIDAMVEARTRVMAAPVVKPVREPRERTVTEATHTHTGTCQVCGSRQAVDNRSGKLANHGYRVAWGQHSGHCDGSRYAPYEVSCEQAGRMAAHWDAMADDRDAKLAAGIVFTTPNQQWQYEAYTRAYREGARRMRLRVERWAPAALLPVRP